MKKFIFNALAVPVLAVSTFAQNNTYFTKTGHISFFSKSPLENIEAHNRQVTCMLNVNTGEIAFKVLIKSFEFEKALMQEHFNENYMHSEKFPKSTFDGKIVNLKDINFSKEGVYEAKVEGTLEIHGVKREIKETGKIEVGKGKITVKSVFFVALKDYNIKNDKIENIAENIQITVDVNMEPYNR